MAADKTAPDPDGLTRVDGQELCPECGGATYDAVLVGEIPERWGLGCRACGWGVGSECGD